MSLGDLDVKESPEGREISVTFKSENGISDATEQTHQSDVSLPMGLGADMRASELTSGGETSLTSHRIPLTTMGQLSDFLCRRTKVGNGTIVAANTFGVAVLTLDPWVAFISDTFIAAKVRDYRLIRGDMEVTLVLTSPPGAYGKAVLYAYPIFPLTTQDGTKTFGDHIQCYPQYIHAEVDFAVSNDVKLTLPWNHPYSHGTIDSGSPTPCQIQWEVKLVILEQIGVGIGSSAPVADFTVYANLCPGYELLIPYFQGGGKDSGSMSGVMHKVSKAAGLVADKVPFISSLATPISKIADVGASVLEIFGFTRTAAQQTPQVMTIRPFSNVANFDCDDTSELAALSVANTISIDPSITGLGSEDITANNYLFDHWTLVGIAEWEAADAQGGNLATFPVTPFLTMSGANEAQGMIFPVAGFVGYPFSMWRGDMEYRFLIPVSKFHRGKIQIAYQPGSVVSGTNPTNNRFNQIFDVETGDDFTFSVGYTQPTPMTQCRAHLFGSALVSTSGTNGLIEITVVNPLRSQSDTADTKIFVFARCKNAFFAYPRHLVPMISDTGSQTFVDLFNSVALQGALGSEVNETTQEMTLVPSVPMPDLKNFICGEEFGSVRAMMQKFSKLQLTANHSVSLSTGGRSFLNHFPPIPKGNASAEYWAATTGSNLEDSSFTYFGYYSSMYHGLAGSTRYKVATVGTRPISVVPVPPQGTDISDFGASYAGYISQSPLFLGYFSNGTTNGTTHMGVEVTVPYYGRYLYEPRYRSTSAVAWTGENAVQRLDCIESPQVSSTDPNNFGMYVYIAAGPDVRPHRFRGVRGIIETERGGDAINPFVYFTATE